jgi:hypothetical protein
MCVPCLGLDLQGTRRMLGCELGGNMLGLLFARWRGTRIELRLRLPSRLRLVLVVRDWERESILCRRLY